MKLSVSNLSKIYKLNLDETINSGQVFLWKKIGRKWYGVDGNKILVLGNNEKFTKNLRYEFDFFRFDDNFEKITKELNKDRKRALSEPCVVISPAGMLVGGNAVYYLQQLAFDERNGIALVSYQGEGTPGKKLLETGKISTRGKDLNVVAQVKQFQFSGHADRDSLFEMIKKIKGNPKVLTVHGDNQSCTRFAEEIHEKFGFDAYAPKIGETVSI